MTNTKKDLAYILRKKAVRDIITNCNVLDNQITYLYDTDRFRETKQHKSFMQNPITHQMILNSRIF